MSSQWYHVDIRRISHGVWRGYIVESELFVSGVTRHTVQEEARRIIEETTGVDNPRVIWNEC